MKEVRVTLISYYWKNSSSININTPLLSRRLFVATTHRISLLLQVHDLREEYELLLPDTDRRMAYMYK